MKRSSQITLRLVPVVSAAFLAGCGPPEQRACVDQFKRVVDSHNCQDPNGSTGSFAPGTSYPYIYHWYWFRSPVFPGIGTFAPPAGQFTEPTAVERFGQMVTTTTRGGFGSTAGHGMSTGA